MLNVLGPSPKPGAVWQRQFDGHDDQLAEMAKADWDRLDAYLWYYILDLAYQPLQPDLFRHCFPACLKLWYESLMANEDAARGDAELHNALDRGQAHQTMMSDDERRRLYDFFRDGMLDRIEAERGFVCEPGANAANAWIRRFNSLGKTVPVIPQIWGDWWRLDSPGKAVAAVMYASGLVFFGSENPIYIWTPKRGGGGPYLTYCDSWIYDHGWREDNLTFLRQTLTLDYVLSKLNEAAAVLASLPEAAMAAHVAASATSRTDVIHLRIDDLIDNLAIDQLSRSVWE